MAQKVLAVRGNKGARSVLHSCDHTPLGPLPPKIWDPKISKI